MTQKPRIIGYYVGGRRYHGAYTQGWSSPIHYSAGIAFHYRLSVDTGEAIVDMFFA